MSDYQTFDTRQDAQREIATMRGWTAKAVRLTLATPDGRTVDRWVIQCDGTHYLRADGFVR